MILISFLFTWNRSKLILPKSYYKRVHYIMGAKTWTFWRVERESRILSKRRHQFDRASWSWKWGIPQIIPASTAWHLSRVLSWSNMSSRWAYSKNISRHSSFYCVSRWVLDRSRFRNSLLFKYRLTFEWFGRKVWKFLEHAQNCISSDESLRIGA